MLKRLFDIAASLLAMVLAWPVIALCAIAVKIDSPGPAFFRQERVGRGGHPFRIVKLRTMSVSTAAAPLVSTASDARITRVGRFLRKWKLDELPQMWNIIRGDMSFVGPRPEVAPYVALWPAAIRDKVLSVRPGLTDEASIRFRHESELLDRVADAEHYYVEELMPQKLRMYVAYTEGQSFWRDMRILLATLRALRTDTSM